MHVRVHTPARGRGSGGQRRASLGGNLPLLMLALDLSGSLCGVSPCHPIVAPTFRDAVTLCKLSLLGPS